eukprot:6116351-Amphidinium_carterae.2
MGSFETLCPEKVERHNRLNHSRITDHNVMRRENLMQQVMLLDAQTGAKLSTTRWTPAACSQKAKEGKDKGQNKGKDSKGKADKDETKSDVNLLALWPEIPNGHKPSECLRP